ncbi:MAG: hypothetical protein JWL63_244 [Rhodocyclales bacterium]|nr:hypothetical protein [Rhodocyclales bacterium]
MSKILRQRPVTPCSYRGLTLIEMMVAMVISLVVSTVAASVFISSRQTARYADALSRYQETLRFAQAAIAEDLRTAGQLGCRRDLTTTTGLKENDGVTYSGAINGKDNWDITSTTLGSIDKTDAKAGSDAVRLQFASRDANNLSAAMAGTADNIVVANTANYAATGPLIIADCTKADTFKPSTDVVAGNTITHTPLSGVYVKSAASVYRFLDRAYYISSSNELVQVTGNTKSTIAVGIEELRFDYGEDINTDKYPDRYVNASDVTHWTDIVAVRVCMLVSSKDQGLTTGDGYTDCNGTAKTATDHRLRFPVNFTVRIRNRG